MKNDSAYPVYLTGGRARAMGAFLIAEGILGALMIPLGLLLGWGAAEGGRLLKLLGWPDLGFGNAPAFICAFLSVWCGAAALITAIGAAGLMRGRKAAFQFLQAGCGQKCAVCLAAALAALALQAMRLIGNSQVMSRKNIAASAAVLVLSAAGFALGFLYLCGALRAVRRARPYADGSAPSRKPAARHTAGIAVWLGCALELGAAAMVGLKYSLSRVYSYRALGQFLQSYWQIAAFGLFAAAGRFFVAAGWFREMKEAADEPASLRPEDTHKSLTALGIFGALSLLWLSFMGASELVNSWEWTSRADILLAVLKIAALGLMAAGLLCRSKKASAAFLALGCVLYLGLSVREISDAVFQTAHNRGAYLRYLYAVLAANGLRVLLLALCAAMCLARLFSARKSALSALRLPSAILAGRYLAALALSCILKQQVYSRQFDWYFDVVLTLLSFVPAAVGAFSLVFSAPHKGPALQADAKR